jgi:hypothetical protein
MNVAVKGKELWMLSSITSYTLTVNITTVQLMWPSMTNKTLANVTVIIVEIAGYPELWQLYNETLETHLAHPVGDKYLVYYNTMENTVFCDWERLVEGVELSSTQPPIETPPEIQPMPI